MKGEPQGHPAELAGRARLDVLQGQSVAVSRVVASIGVAGMLLAAGATVLDVLMRWAIGGGVLALNEVVTLIFFVAVAACLPAGFAMSTGVTVNLLERRMSDGAADRFIAIGALAQLIVIGLLAWCVGAYAMRLSASGSVTMILAIPQAPFIWTTAALLGLATLAQAIATLVRVRRARRSWHLRGVTAVDHAVSTTLAALAAGAVLLAVFFAPIAAWAQSHPLLCTLAGFLIMWAMLLALMPLAAAMAIIGLVGTALYIGFMPAFSAFASEAVGFLNNYQVAALPLFLMMGSFAAVAGVTDDLYRLAQAVLGRFRGGLAMATIGGSAGFGAVTGSSLATVATFGRIALPQMQSRRYAPQFAAGCVAAGGTLGALIPPSTPLIIFALLTEASIGQLFVAAVVPGLLAAAIYLVTVTIVVRRKPEYAPVPETIPAGEFLAALKHCGPVAALFFAVIGGIYSGFFTPTEGAAVGAFGAFLIALLRGKLRRDELFSVMSETTASTAMFYTLIFGVLIFSFFVGIGGIPERLTSFVGALQVHPLLVIAILVAIYMLLGCAMDSFAVMIITVPIVTPIILHMGYDIVWWGIINLMVVELGLITPPFGLHLFVLKSMVPDMPLESLYRGVIPFCLADLAKLALLILLPVVTLWLPSTMH